MKTLFYFCILIFLISLLSCSTEKKNPFEGTTWEIVSAKYTWGDSTFIRPTSEFHKSIGIWGKRQMVAIWQDTSKQDIFYVGHKYTIEGDTIIFKIKFWPDSRFIGHSFKVKYEIKENQLLIDGVIPRKEWGLEKHDMKIHEVWKRID